MNRKHFRNTVNQMSLLPMWTKKLKSWCASESGFLNTRPKIKETKEKSHGLGFMKTENLYVLKVSIYVLAKY